LCVTCSWPTETEAQPPFLLAQGLVPHIGGTTQHFHTLSFILLNSPTLDFPTRACNPKYLSYFCVLGTPDKFFLSSIFVLMPFHNVQRVEQPPHSREVAMQNSKLSYMKNKLFNLRSFGKVGTPASHHKSITTIMIIILSCNFFELFSTNNS